MLSPRLGLFAMMMMPATILHLAMRFPVVAPRFRKPAVAAVPYAFWLAPAAFAQLHLEDAALLNSMERIAIGATFVSAGILAAASVTFARAMTPIERARTRALLLGLGLGSAAPLVYFLSSGRPPPGMRTLLILSPLIFPAAISWAIVRYRLLDPPLWLQRTVLTSLTAAVSLLLAMAAVTGAFALLDPSGSFAPGEAIPIALTTTILYQAFQSGLKRTAGGRLLPERSFEAFLDEATRVLANVTRPSEVLQRITSLLPTHLDASGVECFTVAPGAAQAASPLARQGVALWRSGGAPGHRLVRARARSEDPAPDLAELVIPLSPQSGPRVLVTLASRTDGLPYTDEQERMLESLLHVATTALDAAATAEDLELRVVEKTASLERALRDRKRVLEAARAICEAEQPEEIVACLERFAAAEGGHVCWEDAWRPGESDRLMSRLSVGGQPDRFLLVEALPPERLADLRPQLETLCTFAGLALARLELLSELKREVERQAAEIADITSRRLHAEFVRGVAHELRKPTEEVRQRVEALLQGGSDAQEATLARIQVATQEMSRRLDLLLFHSGLRLDRRRIDLVRVVDDAIHGVRAICPDRDFQVDHERSRLPVIGDPTRLLSVIENLLDNAINATREGQRIAIRTWIERQDSGEGSWACLEVEDEGTGIQEEHIEQIFEPGIGFTPSGFGLGLSLCRAIVRMHGGRIATQSQPGRTIFRVHLPQFPRIPEESESDDSCHPAG